MRKIVSVAILALVGCAALAPKPPPPVLARVGPVDAIKVQFIGRGYADSEMWVCGRGDLVRSSEFALSCVPYEVFMQSLETDL